MKTILYIDDDLNNGHLMKRTLEADGYRVLLAINGATGLVQADRNQPDLIMLDIYLPDLSGHEVARRLRHMDSTRSIPILMVSVSTSSTDQQLSHQNGCKGYIAKPIDVDAIGQQIAAYL